MPPPFAVTVRQALLIQTFFTSSGNLTASGSFKVEGGIGITYTDGSFIVPTLNASMQTNMVDTIHGYSIGANGLVLTHQVTVIVGIGAVGFVTGPYVALNSSVTTT